MNINHDDLNLLKVLSMLLQEKNTKLAAEKLNASQPAISRSLAKIRNLFDDPLFIRHSRGLSLTPRGEKLANSLPQALTNLQLVLEDELFNPASLKGKFIIAMNGFLIETHGHKIFEQINKHSPALEIEIHNYNSLSSSQLINGDIDLAINYYPLDVSKSIYQKQIAVSQFSALSRYGNFKRDEKVSLKQIVENKTVGLIAPEFNSLSMRVLLESKWAKQPLLRSQNINPLLEVIKNSNAVMLVPNEIFYKLDPTLFQLNTVKDPKHLLEVKVGIYYGHQYWQSSKYQWLENLITHNLC
ncbi:LysR family transcriptional regulator [Thalassotalea psychrophila]|uniref:LysR family transcriptional regulator n=1 Tax=Thalassotalea psychrophila TaxID=3065647 RepID=A0ABY9TYD6_9GAMM|nr:LysR family transcriptional regulator [Colwelliaceae bacterium SQ149]